MNLRRAATAAVALAMPIALATPAGASTDHDRAAKRLSALINSVTPDVLNPTPDTSSVTVAYTAEADATSVSLQIRNADDDLVFEVTDLPTGNEQVYEWSPVRDTTDAVPPDGRYQIVLIAATAIDSVEDTDHVVLDTVPPPIGSATSDIATLYPYDDGYRDRAHFTVKGIGRAAVSGRIEIKDSDGLVARTLPFSVANSSAQVAWNGSLDVGGVAPAGRYSYRAIVADAAGNEARTSREFIGVSSKRAVALTFTKTLSAWKSFAVNIAGRCSNLYHPGVRDWEGSIGYYSGALCDDVGGRAGLARGLHAVRVPEAEWYDAARVRTWGASTYRRDRAVAEIQFLNGPRDYAQYGAPQKIGPKVGWHSMESVEVDKLIKRDTRMLAWSLTTRAGNWYDVKQFAITLHYHVLRQP